MLIVSKCFTNNHDKKCVAGNKKLSFGWHLKSDKKNTVQTAYETVVYDDKGEAIWNSGKQESSQTRNIRYQGKALGSGKTYSWSVTVWDNQGETAQSKENHFEMGLLNADDWEAKWIEADIPVKSKKEAFNPVQMFAYHGGKPEDLEHIPLDPPVVFHKEFLMEKTENKLLKRGRLYITAHGVYEACLNGEKIGEDYLAPGFTSYPELQYYQTYDITGQLREGINKIEVTVADGWYKSKIGLAGIGHQFGNNVALLAQLEVEFIDGERIIIGTDSSFQATTGEIEYADLFIGEKHNHMHETKDFYRVQEKTYGYQQLKADPAEPIQCVEKIKPIRMIRTPKGEVVLYFGRNIAGIVEMKVEGQKGDTVLLQHAEELDAEGNFFFNLMGQNKYQITTFCLRGGKEETFLPRFTYQGFRYVKVTGYPGECKGDHFTAYVLASACQKAGKLTTSNAKINQLLSNIYHSQQGNFISVPTDCPQREKGGWTGDAQVYIPTAILNMKIDNFMKRWLENMRLEQYENGQIPGLIPWIESDNLLSSGFGNISSAGWGDACIIIPWHLYVQYEDISFLKENYEMMKKWIAFVESRCASNINEHSKDYEKYIWDMDFHYGDWMTPSLVDESGIINPMMASKLTANQTATMYFAHSTELLSKIASVLGKNEEQEYYQKLSEKVKDAFIKAYVKDGRILNDMQGLYAMAAHFRMGTEEMNHTFARRLEEKIIENRSRLDTGFLGTPILLDSLVDHGKKELAYKLLMQEECPSWLYQVNQGATTVWETWDAIAPDGKRNVISYNHYAFGSVEDFIVRKAAGFRKVAEEKGKYVIEPDFEAPFSKCEFRYQSPYGTIESEWEYKDGKGEIRLDIPTGVNVILSLPGCEAKNLGSGVYQVQV